MNNTEALALVRMTRALCSGQRLDEYAPDAWAVVLADIRFADAKEALVNLGKIQPSSTQPTSEPKSDASAPDAATKRPTPFRRPGSPPPSNNATGSVRPGPP